MKTGNIFLVTTILVLVYVAFKNKKQSTSSSFIITKKGTKKNK